MTRALLILNLVLTISFYGQTKFNFAFNTGIVNSYTKNLKSTENVSFPNVTSIKLGFDLDIKIKNKYSIFSQFDLFRHKQKYTILYKSNINNKSTNTASYLSSNIYNLIIGCKYNFLNVKKWSFNASVGPQLFFQPKTGLLTNSIDSLVIIKDSVTANFVTLSSVSAQNKFNLGYRINLEFLKNINDNRYLYYGLTLQNSFSSIRESNVISYKNNNLYEKTVGNYKGLSFMLTFGYGFKF